MALLFLLVLALPFYALVSSSESNQNVSCATESQLQALQVELIQLYVRTEEQLEAVSTKLHHLTQSLESLSWTANRVENSVRRLEGNNELLIRNISLLTLQSDQVLLNQQYCANHEALKELFFDLTPKCANASIPTGTPTPPPEPNNRTYQSCWEAPNRSGVYRIAPEYTNSSFEAYCEQERFGGGWIVIQRRQDGSVNFNRNWREFRNGFGDPNGEYWLGLQQQHELTSRQYELLIVLENATGYQVFEKYPRFSVNGESSYYSINLPSRGEGTAGDSLYDYRGEKFVTFDEPATSSYFSCVAKLGSAFWHYTCSSSSSRNNLNGIYGRPSGDVKGIWWDTFGSGYSNQLTKVELMIRESPAGTTTEQYVYSTSTTG